MATAAAVYSVIVDMIEALPVDQSHTGDKLRRHEGDLDKLQPRDRIFFLALTEGPDRVTERYGCEEKRLSFDLITLYVLTPGTHTRMLSDGELLVDGVIGLIGTGGITEVNENGTSYDYDGNIVVSTRSFSVAYSGV